MADNFSIDTGLGLRDNRRVIATDETNSVHTIKVTDTATLAELVATNAALTLEIQKLNLTLVECVQIRLDQIVTHMELITSTVFTPEDVEERDAYY